MKNSGALGLIVLAIIGYILMSVGVIAAIVGICIAVVFLITWLAKTIMNNIKRTKNKRIFINKISSTYNLSQNIQSSKINRKLLFLVDELLSKYHYSTGINDEFELLRCSMRDSLSQVSVWTNNTNIEDYSYKSNALSRRRLKFYESGFLKYKNHSCPSFFSVKTKNTKLYFFPCFIITEIGCDYDIIKYSEIKLTKISSISVEESSTYGIKGASPAYYHYLHQRVDGGPDRRYKNNPSTPVYLYDAFKLCIGKELQIISANSTSSSRFISSLKKYQQALVKHPLESFVSVKDIDLTKNEYASLVEKLIAKHGKEFIFSKSFTNCLKDYRLPNEYPYFLPVFDILYNSNSIERITQEDCKFEDLDIIKNTINTIGYTEMEVATVLAILGHGLQLK